MIARAIGYHGTLTFNTRYADGDAQKIMHDATFRSLFPTFQFTAPYTAIQQTVNYYKTVLCGDSTTAKIA